MSRPPLRRDPDEAVRRELDKATATRDRLRSEERALGADVTRLETALSAARRAGDVRQVRTVERQLGEAASRIANVRDAVRTADGRWQGLVERLDPCNVASDVPLLLLPVRIETRFASTRGGGEPALRIRIFPDTVHIDALRRTLTDDERAAAERYWTAAWTGEPTGVAWADLKALTGPGRASWVAEATRPTNADQAPRGAPDFPLDRPPSDDSGAVARLLPDRFVAVVRQKGRDIRATGRPIPRAVQIGPFRPDEEEDDLEPLAGLDGITLSPSSRWIADYQEAVAAGLAITVPVAHQAVDEVIVFGIHRDSDPAQSAKALADLLHAHRHTGGLAFVPQGTLTNNMDETRSGWSSVRDPANGPSLGVDERLRLEVAEPAADALSAALGVGADVFAGLDHARGDEDGIARAANTILWHPSWGAFLDATQLVDGNDQLTGLGPQEVEAARCFHRDLVRGRGPLPTIRIGKQPYGVLPVGLPAARGRETAGIARKLRPILDNIRAAMTPQVAKLPRIRPGAAIDDRTLLDIFGMNAVSVGVRARTAVSTEMGAWAEIISGAVDTEGELASVLTALLAPPSQGLMYQIPAAGLDDESRPVPLPYVHDTDPQALNAIAAGTPRPPIASVLQALAQLAWSQARDRVKWAGDTRTLETILATQSALSAADRGRVMEVGARAADAPAKELLEVAAQIGDRVAATGAGRTSAASYSPTTTKGASYAELAKTSSTAAGKEMFGAAALIDYFIANGARAELGRALERLAKVPIEPRRIAVAEAIDLASHRVDAWLTALVESRCRVAREGTREGIRIGAFGWVEGFAPGTGRGSPGFIHAPSVAHAATAGVLRSAYLSHNPVGVTGDGAFAIDLSSARVRDAADLLDAVRQGQGLAAAIGYRIERGVNEARLARIILNLRRVAPLSAGKLVDRGDPPPDDVAQHLAVVNVVDGIALLALAKEDFAALADKAGALPPDNPYVDPADWTPLSGDERSALRGVLDQAAASLDAVADLLLAEGTHQLVQGANARASAAFDAAGGGGSHPPAPDVISTPARGGTVQHRLMLMIGAGAARWSTTRVRAAAEPALEAWAASRLGDPADIVAMIVGGTPRTLADTGLAALDLVYGAAHPATFAAQVGLALGAPEGSPIADPLAALLPVADTLRALIAGATPGRPADLALPHGEPTLAITEAAIAEAMARVEAARDALAALRTQLTSRAALIEFAAFGIVVPLDGSEGARKLADGAIARRLAMTDPLLAGDPTAEMLAAAATALFGEGFPILPRLSPVGAGWAERWNAEPIARASAIRRWIADMGGVRPAIRRYGDTLLAADAARQPPTLHAIQLSPPETEPATGWIGTGPAPGVSANLVAEASAMNSADFALLTIDGFAEQLPGDGMVASALAFNAPSPDARPPQVWLLATAPDERNWSSDLVLETLRDTRDLAKLRGVAFEHQPFALRPLPALYTQSWSLQGEDVLDWSIFAHLDFSADYAMRFVKDD